MGMVAFDFNQPSGFLDKKVQICKWQSKDKGQLDHCFIRLNISIKYNNFGFNGYRNMNITR